MVQIAMSDSKLAGLRTRLVSRLTGLGKERLRYWHKSDLLTASLREGQRGVPRLYSWEDYLRLRIAAELDRAGVSTPRIRRAIDFLEEFYPGWYMLPVRPRDSNVLTQDRETGEWFLADEAGQFVLLPDVLDGLAPQLDAVLDDLGSEGGELGELRQFSDVVYMRPGLNLAKPTLRDSALETSFVAGMAEDVGVDGVADLYDLDPQRVRRAIEFEEAANREIPA